jgi:hypothetical protein
MAASKNVTAQLLGTEEKRGLELRIFPGPQSRRDPAGGAWDQVMRLLAIGGFLAKYLRMPFSTALAICS